MATAGRPRKGAGPPLIRPDRVRVKDGGAGAAARFLDPSRGGDRLAPMNDADREWVGLVARFQELDRRLREEPPRREAVLPPDLDVEEEMERCFSQPGRSVWVSVV